jgi:hypothetical protein
VFFAFSAYTLKRITFLAGSILFAETEQQDKYDDDNYPVIAESAAAKSS